jgi:hypothetical protein
MTDHDADDAFIRHKSRFVLSWALANLQRLHERPSATSAGSPLAGRTAIVVGASYNLTRNVHLLKDAQEAGCAILCTNSADAVLRSEGVVPDVLVVRESLKHDADIAASQAPLIVADVCVHPDTWTAAGSRLAWFIPCYPHLLRYAEIAGVRPVFGGSAAYTTAVHLARTWGASRIVMVGSGLSPVEVRPNEWQDYHPKAPRGDQLGKIVEHPQWGEVLSYTGNVANDALHVESGQRPPPKLNRFKRYPSIDWSTMLPVIDTLEDQKRWLETEAARHGGSVLCLNANEGGIGVAGWKTETLASLVQAHGTIADWHHDKPVTIPAVYPVSLAIQRTLVDQLTHEAETQQQAAEEMLRHGGPRLDRVPHLEGLHEGAPLPSALAAWRIIDAPRGDARAELEHVYGSLRSAAQDTLGIHRIKSGWKNPSDWMRDGEPWSVSLAREIGAAIREGAVFLDSLCECGAAPLGADHCCTSMPSMDTEDMHPAEEE